MKQEGFPPASYILKRIKQAEFLQTRFKKQRRKGKR